MRRPRRPRCVDGFVITELFFGREPPSEGRLPPSENGNKTNSETALPFSLFIDLQTVSL